MENLTLHRGRLIDHIQLVTSNFEASKAFYISVFRSEGPGFKWSISICK